MALHNTRQETLTNIFNRASTGFQQPAAPLESHAHTLVNHQSSSSIQTEQPSTPASTSHDGREFTYSTDRLPSSNIGSDRPSLRSSPTSVSPATPDTVYSESFHKSMSEESDKFFEDGGPDEDRNPLDIRRENSGFDALRISMMKKLGRVKRKGATLLSTAEAFLDYSGGQTTQAWWGCSRNGEVHTSSSGCVEVNWASRNQLLSETHIEDEEANFDMRSMHGLLRNASSSLHERLGLSVDASFVLCDDPSPKLERLYGKLLNTVRNGDWRTSSTVLKMTKKLKSVDLVTGLLGAWVNFEVFEQPLMVEDTPEVLLKKLGDREHAACKFIRAFTGKSLYQFITSHKALAKQRTGCDLPDVMQTICFQDLYKGGYNEEILEHATRLTKEFVTTITPQIRAMVETLSIEKQRKATSELRIICKRLTQECIKIACSAIEIRMKLAFSAHDYRSTWYARDEVLNPARMLDHFYEDDQEPDNGRLVDFTYVPMLERFTNVGEAEEASVVMFPARVHVDRLVETAKESSLLQRDERNTSVVDTPTPVDSRGKHCRHKVRLEALNAPAPSRNQNPPVPPAGGGDSLPGSPNASTQQGADAVSSQIPASRSRETREDLDTVQSTTILEAEPQTNSNSPHPPKEHSTGPSNRCPQTWSGSKEKSTILDAHRKRSASEVGLESVSASLLVLMAQC